MRQNTFFEHFRLAYGLCFLLLAACAPGPTPTATPKMPTLTLAPPTAAAELPTRTMKPPIPTRLLPTQSNTPAVPDELLPHTLYHLRNGGQVFRMERDGKTVTQLTFEPVRVDGYDVSLADGSVAYVVENQLVLIDADGSNRRVLVDGGPRDENNPSFFKDQLRDPVFSPDGGTIAYGHNHKGLNLYDISASVSNLVIEDQYADPLPNGARIPIETYSPVRYSPDGMKLLLALGHWESPPSHAVYHPDTNILVRYAEVQDYINCCSYHGGPVWSQGSSSFYGVASVHDSAYAYGELWKVDAGSGAATRSFTSTFVRGGTVYLPVEPFPAPDGQLYYFFGTYAVDSGFLHAPVLELVRSAPDGVTDRSVLRDENFVLMDEALWAPDASFVVVSMAPARNWNQDGGVLELYYTNGQKSMVWLAPLGYQMRWGP